MAPNWHAYALLSNYFMNTSQFFREEALILKSGAISEISISPRTLNIALNILDRKFLSIFPLNWHSLSLLSFSNTHIWLK